MIVLDTHALIWWATGAADLSAIARKAIQTGARQRAVVASAISIFEIATAVRRLRLVLNTPLESWLAALGALPELRIEPVTAEIAATAGGFDDEMPGDPADRIIAATALVLRAKLVTADERLRTAARLQTIW